MKGKKGWVRADLKWSNCIKTALYSFYLLCSHLPIYFFGRKGKMERDSGCGKHQK